jgi:WD40 repeat protein
MVVGQRDGTITCCTDGNDKRDVMKSHHEGEVWGLDICSDGTVVTSADDNKVMFWDPANRCNTKCVKVSNKSQKSRRGGASSLSNLPDSQCSRAVAVNDEWLAVAANDGTVTIRRCSAPDDVCHELRDSSEWIEVAAFSPDNQWLAVGSHDNNIYIYSTNGFALQGTCKAHTSYIMAMDWCAHSKYIRSNCGAYELLFFTIPDCQQDKSGRSNTTSVEWATKTVKFSWDTEGIYPSGTDGTHINSVCGSADKQLLATGDDYGLVNLFRDPCRKGGLPRSLRGHSEHVVRVKFSADDSRLFSIGGYDQTLMQW